MYKSNDKTSLDYRAFCSTATATPHTHLEFTAIQNTIIRIKMNSNEMKNKSNIGNVLLAFDLFFMYRLMYPKHSKYKLHG